MLRDGLAVVARPRTLVGALAFSVVAWSASIGTFLAAGQAVGIELTVAQGALLASGVALATIVPSGPGYLGTFELTAVGICSLFGIERDSAFAMALLVHVMILSVTSIGGVDRLRSPCVVGSRRSTRPTADPATASAGARRRRADLGRARVDRRDRRSRTSSSR